MNEYHYFHKKISQTPFRIAPGFGHDSGTVVIATEIQTVSSSRSGVQFKVFSPGKKSHRWLDAGWLMEVK